MTKDNLPVLVGVGQSLSQWDGTKGPAGAPSPLSLMVDASKSALADAGVDGLAAAIDTLVAVRIFEDSVHANAHPHGHNTNLPGTLARDIGAAPKELIYEAVGGQSPQALVNEMSRRIFDGEIECALISGSEANRTSKAGRKHNVDINWADSADAAFEDRGFGSELISREEIKHGLVAPAYFYGLFENAIAARDGETRSEHRRTMAELFQPFTARAAKNPYAQFPVEHPVEFLCTPSAKNYEYADPFLKWFIAQDAVNQGAAVILMSHAKAEELGIDPANRVYLHGGGDAADSLISQRPRLDGSWAMDYAVTTALEAANTTASDIAHLDLYSCFPCAVASGASALGLDWRTDPRPLTLTGGLPFFGGPGNNYSLHGIAEMVTTLRANPGDLGLVLANGGWMTKESVGVYSTTPPAHFTAPKLPQTASEKVTLCATDCTGIVETFTVTHGRSGPENGILFARLENGQRAMAKTDAEGLAILREEVSPVGRKVAISVNTEKKRGTANFIAS